EDGIRDFHVTGVQTCALPISSFLNGVRDYLINTYGYDPGEYQGYSFNSNNTKLFARIDWNINENHKLNFRYNQVEAKSPSFVSRSEERRVGKDCRLRLGP